MKVVKLRPDADRSQIHLKHGLALGFSCPHCGCATITSESIQVGTDGNVRVHVCGDRWETRKFLCGFSREYIPNFSRAVDAGKCTRSKAYLELQETRFATLERVVAAIKTLVPDDKEFQHRMIRAVLDVRHSVHVPYHRFDKFFPVKTEDND